MRVIAPILLILMAGHSAPAGAAACRVSPQEYRALKTGQTLASVVKRIGCSGRKVSDVTVGRQRRINFSWPARGNFGANITLTFVNGRLTDKFELGLD